VNTKEEEKKLGESKEETIKDFGLMEVLRKVTDTGAEGNALLNLGDDLTMDTQSSADHPL
jgi:hypothetical protein